MNKIFKGLGLVTGSTIVSIAFVFSKFLANVNCTLITYQQKPPKGIEKFRGF